MIMKSGGGSGYRRRPNLAAGEGVKQMVNCETLAPEKPIKTAYDVGYIEAELMGPRSGLFGVIILIKYMTILISPGVCRVTYSCTTLH